MGESHLGMDYLLGALQKQEGVCAKGIWHMLKGKSTFFLIVQILVFYSTLNFKRKGSKIEHLFFSHINSTPNKYWAELPQTHLWADKQFHAHKASCSVLKTSLDYLFFYFSARETNFWQMAFGKDDTPLPKNHGQNKYE